MGSNAEVGHTLRSRVAIERVVTIRRFPPPWTVEELDARFVVFFDKGQGPSSTSY